jgi:hypothetical protein
MGTKCIDYFSRTTNIFQYEVYHYTKYLEIVWQLKFLNSDIAIAVQIIAHTATGKQATSGRVAYHYGNRSELLPLPLLTRVKGVPFYPVPVPPKGQLLLRSCFFAINLYRRVRTWR